MKSGKHILLLTPGFPKDESDYLCIPPLQIFLKELKKHPDFKVSVISLQYPEIKGEYNWEGIDVFSCGGRYQSKLSRPLIWKKAVDRFKIIHRQNPVDVVHSLWLNEAALTGNYISKKYQLSHVVTLMGQDVQRNNRYAKFIDLDYPTLVVLSEFQNDILKSNFSKSADQIVPWGIDSEQQDTEETREIDLLGVGSLTKLKDYKTFVEVVAELVKDFPTLKSLIIGDESERKNLEALVKESELSGHISFTGIIPRNEVLVYMKKSKILLHPSTFESQGFVFNEALASGMSIVSRKVGIAKQSGHWKIAANKNQMIEEARQLLNTEQSFDPILPNKVTETVNQYLNIYSEL